ncbi:hypothetical protein SK128_000639 [Halocaridina rubra]|uniref:Uncharacterized protein n=1 Tax=Halocaridina rubra TaxID=373956 RepID=A0AAN8XCM0_HALRR
MNKGRQRKTGVRRLRLKFDSYVPRWARARVLQRLPAQVSEKKRFITSLNSPTLPPAETNKPLH